MSSFPRLLLALLLLLQPALLGAVPAHAQDDEEYDDGDYDAAAGPDDEAPDPDALSPYGSWVEDAEYGRAWRPAVSVGWAPYVDGYWAWTPYGWTWVSYEPWAWTFHYGRWALLPVGWVWIPGTVWGPAWVDWFWADGFVGWAPLSPFGTHVTVINRFVFVHERDFCSRRLGRTVVDHHLVPHRVIHRWQHRDLTHERPPGLHHIERVSQRPIQRLDHKPPGTIAPRGFDGGRHVARPGVAPRLGAARRGDTRLGRPSDAGRAPRGDARLGRAWPPARAPEVRRPALVDQGGGQLPRTPRLARPEVAPRLGATPRGAGSPRFGVGRRLPDANVPRREPGFGRPTRGMPAAPPAIPGGSFGSSAPGLARRGPEHGRALGAAPGGQAHQLHRGGGGLHGQQLSPGAILR